MTFTKMLLMFMLATVIGHGKDVAWLHGIVKDMSDALIPEATVYLASPESRFEQRATLSGTVDFEVPAGVYHVGLTGYNFVQDRRASILLSAGKHATVILRPVFRAPSDQNFIPDTQLRYESLSFASGTALVRFQNVKHQGATIIFLGDAMLSFDTVALYGSSIRCSESSHLCVLPAGGLADVDGNEYRARRIEIDLPKRQITAIEGHVRTIGF